MADNHGHDAGHGAEHHESFLVEEEQPDNGQIAIWGLVVAIVFFGSAGVLTSLFYRLTEYELHDKVMGTTSAELQELRKVEETRLTTYGYVDKDKQIVHIPIEEGMKKVVEEAKK